jgi:uncharacterized protein YukE
MNPLSLLGNIGGNIDSLENQAWQDLSSSSQSQQLKGQMEMNEASQQFSSISTALSNQATMIMEAIRNSKINP